MTHLEGDRIRYNRNPFRRDLHAQFLDNNLPAISEDEHDERLVIPEATDDLLISGLRNRSRQSTMKKTNTYGVMEHKTNITFINPHAKS